MSQWRKVAQTGKIDANQPGIVSALRKIRGLKVSTSHDDILVGYRGMTYWFEIKDPEKALSKKTGELLESQLKPSQIKLRDTWTGHYSIVWNINQILAELGIK